MASKRIQLAHYDTKLVYVLFALAMFGALMVYSTTVAVEVKTVHWWAALQHATHLLLGMVAAIVIVRFARIEWLALASRALMVGVIILLLLTVFGLGLDINGSTRWLRIGGITFQPVEFVKIAMIAYTAQYLSSRPQRARDFVNGVLPLMAVLCTVATLLLLQPDFGSTVLIGVTIGALLLIGGMRWSLVALGVAVVSIVSAILVMYAPYRMERVLTFRDPWADPLGSGFQLSQALIALGRGEWFGVGLGSSVQKLFYLPHPDNDFILAIIGEELGFLAVVALIIAFGYVAWRVFEIATRAMDQSMYFHAYILIGLVTIIVLQAYIHISVNLGLLPTKGITLPLISKGGSSMITTGMMVGLIIRAQREVDARVKR